MNNLLSEYPEYRIIHAHNGELMSYALRSAKNFGTPLRIAHAHNTKIDLNLKYPLKYIHKKSLPHYATHLIGCSDKAGLFYFENHWKASERKVVCNAINTEAFAYNPEFRKEIRHTYDLDGKLVIGHVGRFSRQKNHRYLIKIFRAIYQKNKNARFVLIGDGENAAAIRNKIHKYGLSDAVIMPGVRADVFKWYSAMDFFVLPSRYEGLPVVGVEAQCSGLKCFFSDRITREAKLSDNVEFLNISQSPNVWASRILSAADYPRCDNSNGIREAGYDIVTESEKLQNMYIKMYEGTKKL